MRKAIKKTSSNKFAYAFFGMLLIGISAVAFKYFWPRPQTPIGINQVATDSNKVSLSLLTPTDYHLVQGEENRIDIVINAGKDPSGAIDNKLTAATVELSYEPEKLKVTAVHMGEFFTNTLEYPVIDPVGKKIRFSYGVNPEDGGKTGIGLLASIIVVPTDYAINVTTMAFGQAIIGDSNTSETCHTDAAGHQVCTAVNRIPEDSGSCYYVQVQCFRAPCEAVEVCPDVPTQQPSSQISILKEIITRTDIRAENVEGNLYLDSLPRDLSARDYLNQMFTIDPPIVVAKASADLVDDSDTETDQVNIQDYTQFVIDFGKTGTPGWIRADINQDGKVDIIDYTVLVRQWSL